MSDVLHPKSLIKRENEDARLICPTECRIRTPFEKSHVETRRSGPGRPTSEHYDASDRNHTIVSGGKTSFPLVRIINLNRVAEITHASHWKRPSHPEARGRSPLHNWRSRPSDHQSGSILSALSLGIYGSRLTQSCPSHQLQTSCSSGRQRDARRLLQLRGNHGSLSTSIRDEVEYKNRRR